MKKITVVMPVYNTEIYLEKSLQSVLSQDIGQENFILIAINDGSTDGSLQILENFSSCDSRIKVISKPNTGYGDSMNTGISHARGEYIGIVESDDYALPDMFEKLYQTAYEKDADVVKSNFYCIFEKEKQYNEALVNIPYGEIFSPLKENEIFKVEPSIWSCLYKKKFLEANQITFNPSPGASFQDISFIFKVLLSTKRMICIPDAYLCYRCDNENASVKSPKKVFCIMDEFRVIQKYITAEKKDFAFPIIASQKFKHYMMTYFRIDPLYQYAFLKRMSKELQQDYQAGIMVKEYWTDENWALMQEILLDVEYYFEQNNIEYLNRHLYKEYIINNDLAAVGAKYILNSAKKVIIYGAGIYGQRILKSLVSIREVFGFAVTLKTRSTPKSIEGIPVYEIADLRKYNTESVVVVAISKCNQFPVLKKLKELGFHTVISVDKI